MENNEVKVISIPLYVIILVIAGIIGITITVNKVINNKNVEIYAEISTTEDYNNEIASLRTTEVVSSRSTETTRSEDNKTEQYENEDNQVETIEEQQNVDEIEEIQDEQVESESNNYISVQDITISQDMDLTERTGLSREDFIDLISRVKADKSKFFYENAGTIYDLCQQYELNEIFFCGLISAESGWNIASNHRSTYNYISLMANGKLKQFSSVEDGLEQAAKALHEKYLTPGGKFYHGKTIAGVKTRFCPNSSTWTSLVYGRMKQIYNSK